jgi:SAM-dependent methyltransferase
MSTTTEAIDETRVQEFAGRIFGIYTGAMLSAMIDIGHRTGLFEAAAQGPASSPELARRAGLHERYVREWLGSMASSNIIEYDAASETYSLPIEHAACLTGSGSGNLAPFGQLNTHLAQHVQEVARVFRDGGGVPYEAFRPEFTDAMDALGRGAFDEELIDSWLPCVPGLRETLNRGARVADVACGTGHAIVLLAQEFPRSTFTGYDIAEDAIARGRAEATAVGLTNAHFEVCDVAGLTVDDPLDAVFVFDAIHDMVAPAMVLRRIHDALTPGGVFFMKEPRVSSDLADNIGNPFAPLLYSVSTLHCLTVSLAYGGAGLGTAWGEQVARRMLTDAGLRGIQVYDAPGDPTDAIFVSSKPHRASA